MGFKGVYIAWPGHVFLVALVGDDEDDLSPDTAYLITFRIAQNDHFENLVVEEREMWNISLLLAPGPILLCVSHYDILVSACVEPNVKMKSRFRSNVKIYGDSERVQSSY